LHRREKSQGQLDTEKPADLQPRQRRTCRIYLRGSEGIWWTGCRGIGPDLLRGDWNKIFALALVFDAIYQLWVLHFFYPGEALVGAFFLAIVPYCSEALPTASSRQETPGELFTNRNR